MSGLPSSQIPAAATCPQLAAMKQLSRAELDALAQTVYDTEEKKALVDQDLWSWLADSTPPPFEEFVAEMLYFRQGRFLAEENRVTELTMAQLHYEMLVRNLPFCGNLAAASQLDLCIAIRVDNAQIAAEQEESESKVKEEPSDSPMNDVPSMDEGEDEEEDDDDEEPRKLNWRESGLIRHWEPKLQRFVIYRF